jgi:hypothetical protein
MTDDRKIISFDTSGVNRLADDPDSDANCRRKEWIRGHRPGLNYPSQRKPHQRGELDTSGNRVAPVKAASIE